MNTLLNETELKSQVLRMFEALNPEEQRAVFRFTEYLYLSVELDEVRPGELSPTEQRAIQRTQEGREEFVPWEVAMKELGFDAQLIVSPFETESASLRPASENAGALPLR